MAWENSGMPSTDGPSYALMENGSNATITSYGFNREELVRLLVQTMDDLGYSNAARALESEAHCTSLPSDVRNLRNCILQGRWSDVDAAFQPVEEIIDDSCSTNAARFVVYEQQFLELLDDGKETEALQCLRGDLASYCPNPELLHKLPLLCMTSSREELRKQANWAGAGLESRTDVLRKLQKYISPKLLLPENRLQVLLHQAVEGQKRQTLYPYTVQSEISLLEDLEHSFDKVPQKPLFYLKGHTDEVWFVQFSHNGRYLASASKDTSVIIWDWAGLKSCEVPEEDAIHHCLKGHSQVICLVSWSPDDAYLLSCGRDKSVRLWNVAGGTCERIFSKHTDQVTTCAWMPHGKSFVSGAVDKRIYEWETSSGSCTGEYIPSSRVNDMTVTEDGSRLVVVCADNMIQVFDTASKSVISSLRETVNVTSMSLSLDGCYLLVNTSASDVERPEIHLWDLQKLKLYKRYEGYKQKRYVIRACFGGTDQILVLCGSEDGYVYMWSRHSGNVLARLHGHSATVNSVTWSPSDVDTFASGSDDKTVIIWSVGNDET